MSKRVSQLLELTTGAVDDFIPILDTSAGVLKKISLASLVGIPDVSWTATGESWSYSSFDDTTLKGVVTVPSDATTKYAIGNLVRFSQSTGGTKYGRVTAVTSTTLTIQFASGITLNNEAISSPVYSSAESPIGADNGILRFKEVGRKKLSSAGDTITVSVTARKYYLIFAELIASGSINAGIRFNGDSANNYAYRSSINGAADGTATAQSSGQLAASASENINVECFVVNSATRQKMVTSHVISGTSSAAAAPQRLEGNTKWANTTDAISSISVLNAGTGDYAIGSEVIVYGAD